MAFDLLKQTGMSVDDFFNQTLEEYLLCLFASREKERVYIDQL